MTTTQQPITHADVLAAARKLAAAEGVDYATLTADQRAEYSRRVRTPQATRHGRSSRMGYCDCGEFRTSASSLREHIATAQAEEYAAEVDELAEEMVEADMTMPEAQLSAVLDILADDEEHLRAALVEQEPWQQETTTVHALVAYRIDTDPDRNADPYLIHDGCGQLVALVEHDDTLSVLVSLVLDHARECDR